MKKTTKLLATSAIALTMAGQAALAENIRAIDVTGNNRVEDDTVLSYVSLQTGDEYSPSKASKVIKTLYRTGLFDHVEIKWDAGKFVIEVRENPLVNKVAFEGNDEVVGDRLNEIVRLKSRAVFTTDKAQQDVQAILAYYRQKGHFLAKVTPELIQRDQNRVDVVYVVEEGAETKVENIRFVGNERFSDEELKSLIRTKENRWWRLMTSTDVYDPELVEVDKELLRRHYIESGFADFSVVSAVAELSRNKDEFYLTFTIDEGERYDFGEVDVRLDKIDEDVDRDELLEILEARTGDVYNGALVEKDMELLVNALGSKGFAFLDVQPKFVQDEANRKINLSYDIVPGPRVYVNRININGNDRTRDYVVRREMRFAEGDAFSSNKLQRSKDRLGYLGYFEDVSVRHAETGLPDRVDIDVNVKEQSTGEFNVGAGFSSYEGALFTTQVKERNFLGKGQTVDLSLSFSGKKQNYTASFTEPYFMGRELSAGIDLFNEAEDVQDESSYDTDRFGGGVRFGIPLSEYSRNFINVGYKSTDIKDVADSASQFIKREEGEKASLFVKNTYAYDTRDSRLTPTKGYRVAVSGEYSGFGSDINYLRTSVSGSWHKELKKDWVLSVGGRVGAIADLDGALPVYETFRLGGQQGLRGFDKSGIGPREVTNDDALGGKYLLTNSVEVSYPLGTQLKEMGVNGLFFLDGGIVTEFEDHPDVVDSQTYRISAGTGFYWRSPMGPLRFEFGVPLVKAKEDKTQVFSFSFGTRF